jgi:type II secretory pathway pseudopilin PulG
MNVHLKQRRRSRGETAFSLVEVVLALGLISFALVTILGLFSVGLKINKESSDQIQAADLASRILATRRALPMNLTVANLPIPPLTNTAIVSNSAPIEVAINGTTLTTGVPPSDIYNLNYRMAPASPGNLMNVYLLLWGPPGANAPTNNPGAYYEISTQIAH